MEMMHGFEFAEKTNDPYIDHIIYILCVSFILYMYLICCVFFFVLCIVLFCFWVSLLCLLIFFFFLFIYQIKFYSGYFIIMNHIGIIMIAWIINWTLYLLKKTYIDNSCCTIQLRVFGYNVLYLFIVMVSWVIMMSKMSQWFWRRFSNIDNVPFFSVWYMLCTIYYCLSFKKSLTLHLKKNTFYP